MDRRWVGVDVTILATLADAAARLLHATAAALDADHVPDTVPCCWIEAEQ